MWGAICTRPRALRSIRSSLTDLLNGKSNFYDFYSIQAPVDPKLPGGGGYLVSNIATSKQVSGTTSGNVSYVQAPGGLGVNAVTLAQGRRKDVWRGVDTNFVLRARGGLRISGGTSTGKRTDNQCQLLFDGNPPGGQILRLDGYRDCENVRPFQTNIRGTASYTIPWIDVLFSSTFSYRPGVQVTGTYTIQSPRVSRRAFESLNRPLRLAVHFARPSVRAQHAASTTRGSDGPGKFPDAIRSDTKRQLCVNPQHRSTGRCSQ